jgi:alpha-amylase/alpha-mannosidase (GH57 family)
MRYLCIHGHFYQPPRENPWLEAIELQDSAYPYHDWNERITAECYAPNAATRILDDQGGIDQIVNNYGNISFNFGPTVLSWAQDKAPGLYQMILDADQQSILRFNGHGSAIAQAYNHMIMPLANSRDKRTQIIWGIEDFKYRFKRDPEGMWLPETAVDLETLDLLAERGIKYTILAQHQAHLIRNADASEWVDVTGGRIDPSRGYYLNTPSGRRINVFFYDGPISRAVAFEGLLNNGEVFAQRLMTGFADGRDWPELGSIATDGESYGHHHRHGEMALAYALNQIETKGLAKITNYGEYLALNPPTTEVEIYENTAWSCAHGVGRWRSDCGCNSGGHQGWNQAWRGPLRDALDWLRDELAPKFQAAAAKFLRDPWAARNDYIQVVLDRSPECRQSFLARHAKRKLTPDEQVDLWKLLELQRHAMLMYTSCGWFFDELSGIETAQVIEYAGRAVQLAEDLFGNSKNNHVLYAGRDPKLTESMLEETLEAKFLTRLALAKSNIPEFRDGAHIYEKLVKPTMVDLHNVAAHYAISSVFNSYPDEAEIYCYEVKRQDHQIVDAGKLRLIMGRATFTSKVTQEHRLLTYGVLYFGDHNLTGGVRRYYGADAYEKLAGELKEVFDRADVPEVIRLLDKGFGGNIYSLKSLFRDEQRNVLDRILTTTLDEAEAVYRQLYEHHAPLMRFLTDLHTPLPKAFRTTAEYALNSHLKRALAAEELDIPRIKRLLEEARAGEVELDSTTLEFTFRKTVERLAKELEENATDLGPLTRLCDAVSLIKRLPFPVTLWTVQNVSYEILQTHYPYLSDKASQGDEDAQLWTSQFQKLAQDLRLRVQ